MEVECDKASVRASRDVDKRRSALQLLRFPGLAGIGRTGQHVIADSHNGLAIGGYFLEVVSNVRGAMNG